MFRCYIEDSQYDGTYVYITGSDVNHIVNVMRLGINDWITACNGEGTDYIGQISELSRDEVKVKVGKVQPTGSELDQKLYLFQGIPKGDKMDLIIQKAVEIGAYEIIPVEMERCVSKLKEEKKKEKKISRWQSISESASKQSDRGIIPKVRMPISFKEALKEATLLDYSIIPYELQEGMQTSKKIIEDAKDKKSVGIFIGPEGGISENEIEAAISSGVLPVSLGRRILRTETAGLYTLSVLAFQAEG
ncbi:MAG: 16S rRNA (uracil(1498)-N(3))-methyltransferase [Lachnospiraceae bacterium]|nr:16S rRNA (uracil(1498)-N(3))-methyltransferase [Lachnospiraceae bacterium]